MHLISSKFFSVDKKISNKNPRAFSSAYVCFRKTSQFPRRIQCKKDLLKFVFNSKINKVFFRAKNMMNVATFFSFVLNQEKGKDQNEFQFLSSSNLRRDDIFVYKIKL